MLIISKAGVISFSYLVSTTKVQSKEGRCLILLGGSWCWFCEHKQVFVLIKITTAVWTEHMPTLGCIYKHGYVRMDRCLNVTSVYLKFYCGTLQTINTLEGFFSLLVLCSVSLLCRDNYGGNLTTTFWTCMIFSKDYKDLNLSASHNASSILPI